ncbi:MAG: hypothetical protein CO029_00160 [Candidatus Magasanikbacteria bacterium CG_4_9_14_0_2_um_filter_41_10]|uniref:Uncharacterized protein n=1 Tax=Candidatus Magasanikbacteria bacterium CG_4_10_14_0_2_um_filter_41_31 TaxID=1974639 RepID=A0A2M7V452_9BACT|nr:MAG: hypothetical protein COX83_02330 [Candidatus Magasanikbacteria bacterium CG_4_10_14_0_2_um_filter_41_31]PJC53939.1 MAG: hypothetical protein CO029_00160 [Candidatus Magasanikbacteria bacterium CG_4_9_14_0_2_um_filter_41_10]
MHLTYLTKVPFCAIVVYRPFQPTNTVLPTYIYLTRGLYTPGELPGFSSKGLGKFPKTGGRTMRLSDLFHNFSVENSYARRHCVPERRGWLHTTKGWALEAMIFIVSTMMEDESKEKSGITTFDFARKYRSGSMQMFLHSFPDYYVDDPHGEDEEFGFTNGIVRITLNRPDSTDLEQVCSQVFDLQGEAGYSRILSNQGKVILLREWEKMLRQELIQYRSEYSGAMKRKITEVVMILRQAIKNI